MEVPLKFRFIWASSFRGEDLKKMTHQKQQLLMAIVIEDLAYMLEWSISKNLLL
jgi:hypothetical protein